MTRNITRIANSDGIIARTRAAPLRKTTRKATKMIATVRPKLSVSVGTRYSPIFAWSSPWPRPGGDSCAAPRSPTPRSPRRAARTASGPPRL